MIYDPKTHNKDIRLETQIQFLIVRFFGKKENWKRTNITINDIMGSMSENMDMWISLQEDQSNRDALEKVFRKYVQDTLSDMKKFVLITKGMDGNKISEKTIQPLERIEEGYQWKRGKDFHDFCLYVLGELGDQFDIMIGTDEDEIDPYSDRCILTKQDQLALLNAYRKSGLTP